MNRASVRSQPLMPRHRPARSPVAGCGSSEDAPAGAKTLSFELTDAGCAPNNANAPAGPVAFEVENTGTAKVTEFEVLDGEKILGEKEDITEGLTPILADPRARQIHDLLPGAQPRVARWRWPAVARKPKPRDGQS